MNAYKLWKDAAITKSGSREKLGTEAAIHRGRNKDAAANIPSRLATFNLWDL